jgi:hypothetical protein
MTQKKDNLMKLAKGVDKKTKTLIVKKEEVNVPEKKVLSPEEERDLKTKEKVESLLDGIDLTVKTDEKKEELIELDPEPESKDINWLEEQVTKLGEENENLKSEIVLAKADYTKLFEAFQEQKNGVTLNNSNSDGQLQLKVIQLFNEIQAQYLSLRNNLIIYPEAFLNRLILFFPFLEYKKRY